MAVALLLLGGCANLPQGTPERWAAGAVVEADNLAAPALWAAARAALARGDADTARTAAQRLVLLDPRSARAHLLLGTAHHLAGDPASLDQALTGYGAARQLGGDEFWAPLLAGLAAMDRNESDQALEHFAAAALTDPDQAVAFEGLAAAAYAQGRLTLAEAAAHRALQLQHDSAPAWHIATLCAAGSGRPEQVQAFLRQPPAGVRESDRAWLQRRSQNLLRTADVDRAPGGETALRAQAEAHAAEGPPGGGSPSARPGFEAANQITVDVTLILAEDRRTRAYGVNLLDGLTSIFSASRAGSFSSTEGQPFTGSTTITRAISLPALTYNLNIFNRGSRNYEMLARPSLTAHQGQESTFFVGEQLAIQVSGVNTSSLEKLDVGVTLKVNPSEIRPDGATFRIAAERSFFSDQGVGSFAQGVATFKQSVEATADIRFGQTLILSGLTESVTDGADSRVPVLGDIPGPDMLFSRQTQVKRERSVLILVTPSQPQGLSRGNSSGPALEKLLSLWDRVLEPHSGLDALARRLAQAPKFSRAAQGDVQVRRLSDPQLLGSLLAGLGATPGLPQP